MGDQLEQFIINNKDSFNDVEPSENVWRGINKRVNRRTSFLQIAWKVAAVLFMVSTIYLLVDRASSGQDSGPQLSGEFQEAEDYYLKLINLKVSEIQERLTLEQREEFLLEIDHLDVLYADLKHTFQSNSADDRLIDAMINNLRIRLEILNKQLEIIENFKNEDNESETTINI